MKKSVLFGIVFLFVICLMTMSYANAQDYSIPKWIKNNAAWWAQGQIGDPDFLKGIQYLIEQKILRIPETKQSSDSNKEIPAWVKNNAKWWSEAKIGDSDFVSGIQYLVQNGIIVVQQPDSFVKQKEVPIVEDKQTVMKTNAIFSQGELTGCTSYYEPSFVDIIHYKVENDNIELLKSFPVSEDLRGWQDDVDAHLTIWQHFAKIVPPKYLNEVAQFTIFTDGEGWQEMDVWPNQDYKKWEYLVDIEDLYCRGKLNEQFLKRTVIHEFGHMITLDSSQIDIDYELANVWFRGNGDYKKMFKQREPNCSQTFMTHSGCSKENSYMNLFVKEFKIGKFSQSVTYNYAYGSNEWEDRLWSLYISHSTEFVTDYAASDPHEDIAESWTAFVLKEKPQPTTIANKKILFFYNFPELVEIRSFMRSNL